MAGVASGLALATTLMAMQVADSMSTRGCPYHSPTEVTVDVSPEHGFLGIRYVFHNGVAEIDSVLPGTPAEQFALQPGDHVISINGDLVDSASELQEKIYGSPAGSKPTLVIERSGTQRTVRPTLVAWPAITY
jgi:S1-C subfamily serine protease